MIGKKIIIIGCPGAGKSHFARELHQILNYPLFYMDVLFWRENWTHITNDELKACVKDIMTNNDEWIIDGNYKKSLEDRFIYADTVFFLDIEEEVCLKQEKERRGKPRDDLPSFLKEEYDPEFEQFIKDFKVTTRPYILELMEKYPNKNYYVFKDRKEKDKFLNSLRNKNY